MKRPWSQSLIWIGAPLVGFGILGIFSEAILVGLVFFLLGAPLLLIGAVVEIVRFAMRRHLIPQLLLLASGLILAAFVQHRYCFTLAYLRNAREEPYRLWISALKGLDHSGPVYYVGSEGEFSYFRAGVIYPLRFKAVTAKIGLPRTFPLGKKEPYPVTQDMVYYRES